MPTAGLLLTGGASRRMGSPKAVIVVEGRSLGARTADALGAVARPVFEVGPGFTDLATVADPGVGPLGAIAAGAGALGAAGHAGPVLVVACDLPMLDAALLRLIADRPGAGTVIPIAGGRAQPLCARWAWSALARSADLVARGERRMDALTAGEEAVDWLDEAVWAGVCGAHVLDDADTPEELASILSRRARRDGA